MNSRGKEMPHGTRLYSIASSRYGDDFDGKTTTLCVRRATYWDSELGKEDPAKKGICSNFLCDAEPGTEVTITGPTGKARRRPFFLPSCCVCVLCSVSRSPSCVLHASTSCRSALRRVHESRRRANPLGELWRR